MKTCFEVLQHRNFIAKNWLSILYSFVTLQCLKNFKFALNSISACEFCKDVQKFACFGPLECKWAFLIMKTLKNRKFYTYWLTLLHSAQRTTSFLQCKISTRYFCRANRLKLLVLLYLLNAAMQKSSYTVGLKRRGHFLVVAN